MVRFSIKCVIKVVNTLHCTKRPVIGMKNLEELPEKVHMFFEDVR